jgi:hypothetical protein
VIPIIYDSRIVMDDINLKYPVTNVMWQYMDDMTLGEYLNSLGVDYKRSGFIKGFPRSFYLRIGFYKPGYAIDTNSHLYDHLAIVRDNDPWHRKFKVFPIGINVFGNEDYKYFALKATGLSNYGSGYYNCYVIVTTVSGTKVYCVDVLN